MDNMKYSDEVINNNILMLRLSGDLIGEDNGASILELATEYLNKNMRHCIVDISEIRYINSSGIGVLITILILLYEVENTKKILQKYFIMSCYIVN